jgi:hypothetical protein
MQQQTYNMKETPEDTAVQPVDDTLDVHLAGGMVYVPDPRRSAAFLDT